MPWRWFYQSSGAVSSVDIWLPAFDLGGNIAGTNLVSGSIADTSSMFQDGVTTTAEYNWWYGTGRSLAASTADGPRTEIDIGPLQDAPYAIYLYASLPGNNATLDPIYVVNNSTVVKVPARGYGLTNFVEGLNYSRTVTTPVGGFINLRFAYESGSVINGLQLVRMRSLATPVVDNSASGKRIGTFLKWPTIPTTRGYIISRADLGTNSSGPAPASNYKTIATVRMPYFQDANVDRSHTYSYRVQATNEVFQSALSTPVTNSFSDSYTGNYPPAFNGVATLKGAFKNSPFSISAARLHGAAQVYDPAGNQISFSIESVLSGTLEIAYVTNGVATSFTNVMTVALGSSNLWARLIGEWVYGDASTNQPIRVSTLVRWTPPLDVKGTNIPAFSVRAFDGQDFSLATYPVLVNVKETTALWWWGDYGSSSPGNGEPNLWSKYGHSGAEALTGNVIFTTYSVDPGPVIQDLGNVANPLRQLTNIVKVAYANSGVIGIHIGGAITGDGNLYTWGEGLDGGQLGDGVTLLNSPTWDPPYYNSISYAAHPVASLKQVVDFCLDRSCGFAVKSDGSLWVWGTPDPAITLGTAFPEFSYADGNVGNGTNTPVRIDGISDLQRIAFDGVSACIALKGDGSVVWWGNCSDDKLGQFDSARTPTLVPLPEPVTEIAANYMSFYAIGSSGTLYGWGVASELDYNTSLVPDPNGASANYSRIPTRILGSRKVSHLSLGGYLNIASGVDGTVMTWFRTNVPTIMPGLSNIVNVSTSGLHSLAVDRFGRIWGWGSNIEGELGWDPAGGNLSVSSPTLIGTLNDADVVFAGDGRISFASAALGNIAPRDLRANGVDRSVNLTWRRFPKANQYNIKRSDSPDGPYNWIGSVGQDLNSLVQRYTDSPRANYSTNFYRISAVVNGQETLDSDLATAVPLPVPVGISALNLSPSNRVISLSWTPSSNVSVMATTSIGASGSR